MTLSKRPSRAKSTVGSGVMLLATLGAVACDSRPSATTVSVDTTAAGIVNVTYAALPATPSFELRTDLKIGHEPDVVFGDIRGLELAGDSLVLILDSQLSELRAFDLSGAERAVVAKKGKGPREITAANGIWIDDAGAYWIYDHGKYRLTRLLPHGEVETMPLFVPGYGYRWNGGVTSDGRVWSAWNYSDQPRARPEPGVVNGTSRAYYKIFDPATQAADSVFVGEASYRSIAVPSGFASVPFMPERLQALDRSGAIWTAQSGTYRLIRLSARGDTTLVITAAAEPPTVTSKERAEAIADIEAFMERAGRIRVDWDAVIPKTKPILRQLSVDDRGNAWVQRETGTTTVLEGYDREGRFLGRFGLPYKVFRYVPPVLKRGWLLAVQVDSLGVQSVVGSKLPAVSGAALK